MTLHAAGSRRGSLLLIAVSWLVAFGAICERAGAQLPGTSPLPTVRRHSLSLEAQSVANAGRSQVSGTATGVPFGAESVAFQAVSVSDRRVSSNRTNIEIRVRNLGPTLDTARVEWFFIALPINEATAGGHEIVFHRDAQTLAIPGGKTAMQVVSSPVARSVYERSTTLTAAPVGSATSGTYVTTLSAANNQRGLSLRGWMVRLVADDGTVLAAKGSSQAYEEIAANPAKLAGMLARPGSLALERVR